MAQVAANADEYAAPRQNIFFTGVIPELDGQCVSLVKWFMQDMSEVPNPQAARGDARYVGQTLVRQGHALEVPYAERRRGDIICYEYGLYGHIATQLSNGRVFEQNVNMDGVASKIVDGERVYASRIGHEDEAWRSTRNPHIYRLNTYKEGSNMSSQTPVDGTTVRLEYNNGLLRDANQGEVDSWVNGGQTVESLQRTIQGSSEHIIILHQQQLGVRTKRVLGIPEDVWPSDAELEAIMVKKYGGGDNFTKAGDLYVKKA